MMDKGDNTHSRVPKRVKVDISKNKDNNNMMESALVSLAKHVEGLGLEEAEAKSWISMIAKEMKEKKAELVHSFETRFESKGLSADDFFSKLLLLDDDDDDIPPQMSEGSACESDVDATANKADEDSKPSELESIVATRVEKLKLEEAEAEKWTNRIVEKMRETGNKKAALMDKFQYLIEDNGLEADEFFTALLEDISRTKGRLESDAVTTLAQCAEVAFKQDYEDHGGGSAFWKHLKKQQEKYNQPYSQFYPFFCIMQSSGYGKSKLMVTLRRQINDRPSKMEGKPSKIVYLSFAHEDAYPKSNVTNVADLKGKPRDTVELAFASLFARSRVCEEKDYPLSLTDDEKSIDKVEEPYSTAQSSSSSVLFVVDEVSQLLKVEAAGGIDFFRCLRKATKLHVVRELKDYFVLLSTFSSVSHIMPSTQRYYDTFSSVSRHHTISSSSARYYNPSNKVGTQDEGETSAAIEPFLLHEAIGLRNNANQILKWTVEECHEVKTLFSMGRPLWYAYLKAGAEVETLCSFALSKLLQQGNTEVPPSKLSSQQMLALLACRACLTISPVSRFAPALVSSHMGTAVRVSTTMDDGVVVAYPSEPILAIASRSYYLQQTWRETFPEQAFSRMKEYLTCGAVGKGHRGEVIVRLLNLLAIDQCMPLGKPFLAEIKLKDFLAKFDRKEANLSAVLKREQVNLEQEKILLESLNIEVDDDEEVLDRYAYYLEEGKVCFTHFVHLSREHGPGITPNLLRSAYRRTAAIVVDEEGRRGIDWIIPVRIGKDKFVGLAGKDKNRLDETLGGLAKSSNDSTHCCKTITRYFLTDEERQNFVDAKVPLDWPAILFSLGQDNPGAALAQQAKWMRLRHDSQVIPEVEEFPFPCIILTGLQYLELMDNVGNTKLEELRDFVAEEPCAYRKATPLSYKGENSDPMEVDTSNSS